VLDDVAHNSRKRGQMSRDDTGWRGRSQARRAGRVDTLNAGYFAENGTASGWQSLFSASRCVGALPKNGDWHQRSEAETCLL
jgi:hypothetical protein